MATIGYPGTRCGQLDVTKIPIDDYIASGGGVGEAAQGAIWVRASVEEKVYPFGDNKGKVVFKFNDPCVAAPCPNDYLAGQNMAAANDIITGLLQQNIPSANYTSNENPGSNHLIDASDVSNEAKKRVDASSINQYSLFPAAILPCSVVVPLRSNIRPYGPYATSNFHNSCGGINVEVDKDIAPWVFGSIGGMNSAANIRLSTIETDPLVIGTTGSVTVPCLPEISLGSAMLSEGPVLNGLSVNFGAGGISTTYSFQTFTPKFGSFSRATLDRLKLISNNRREQLKLLRNNQILSNRIGRQRSKVDYRSSSITSPKIEGIAKQASLQRVFVGEMMDWWKNINAESNSCSGSSSSVPMYGPYNSVLSLTNGCRLVNGGAGIGESLEVRHNSQRTIVGTETLTKQVLELRWDYEKKAFMSMDGLLGPISVSGDGNLPQYAKYTPKCHRQAPLSPQPPFSKCSPVFKIECQDGFSANGTSVESLYYNQKIEQKFENPVQNPTNCHHHLGSVNGHIIDILGRKNRIDNHMIMNLNPDQDYAEDYRFLGLRGPLVLHSWGYDTWGKPIPNEADDEAQTMQGVFKEENLKDRFLCEWLSKPATWPVGPIDLRFDRDRGVWVAPPQDYKIIVVKLLEDLKPFGTALAQLINKDTDANKDYGPKLWDFEGAEINATSNSSSDYTVIVEDRIKASYKCGTRLYAHYDTFSCKYLVFGQTEASPVEPNEIIRFKLYEKEICEPGGSGTCDWRQYAGYRDKFLNNHTFGIRIDCDGNPIDIEKKGIKDADIKNPDNKAKILVNLYDTAGQHGPAYALYTTFEEWKEKAHTGFAAKIFNSYQPYIAPSGENPTQHVCGDCIPDSGNNNGSGSGSSLPCEEICVEETGSGSGGSGGDAKESCACTLGENQCHCPDPDLPNYDILFLEGYARFIHATLLQDLYPPSGSQPYDSAFKDNCKCGNASANIDGELFYGNSPNGIKPVFYTVDGSTDFRVFDPFASVSYSSPFKNLKAGHKVIAVFNEKEKKYYIYQSEQIDELIKFALIEDKYDINQICTKAIRVDKFNRPIKKDGSLVTSNGEMKANAITVIDSIAEKAAKIPNSQNYSVFGPALGSDKKDDHYNGETLYNYNRGAYSGSIIRPFTGFARYRDISCGSDEDICSGVIVDNTYDIVTLENFAYFIDFEAAEDIKKPHHNYAANYYHFYDGTVPVGRKHELSEYHHDRFVNINIYDVIPESEEYNKRPSHIVGEIIGAQGQGCRGIAKLNTQKSTTDKLIYNIVDSQTQALIGKFNILNCTGAGQLNNECQALNDVQCDPKNVRIYWFGEGFEWSEDDPLTCERRGKIKIINKHEWCGKWYHEPAAHNGSVTNTDLDEYYITDAYPIANVKFGTYEGCGAPSGCEDACDYLDGIHPTCCHPTSEECLGPFLSYSGAQYVAYWNEDTAEYNIINAEESPILIEGTLVNNIDCCGGIADIEVYAADTDGFDKEPIKTLVKSVANPRGWCGKAGDEIVIHRRKVNNCYEYKVLHIGKPCSEGSSEQSGNCLLGNTEVPHNIDGCDYKFFNERIDCIPGYDPGILQQLMHGKGFGLMWDIVQSFQTKVIHGCWNGSSISVQAYAGFNGKDSNGDSIIGQSIPASSPSSCCANQECGAGAVFSVPEGGTAWATATYMSDGAACGWVITNAECCDSCSFSGCDECEPC